MPGLSLLVLSFTIGSSIPRWLGLTLFAPFGEESLKLLLAFGLRDLAHSGRGMPRTQAPLSMRILLFPLGAGLCFGLFEHFYRYGGEGPEVVALRVATHIGFVTIAFDMPRSLVERRRTWRRAVAGACARRFQPLVLELHVPH